MINYLMINLMLTSAALSINHWMHIPHRVRFTVLMTAVIAWLIPFSFMTIELTQQSVSMLPVQWVPLTEQVTSYNTVVSNKFDISHLLIVLMGIGLIRFVMDLRSSQMYIRRLKHHEKSNLKNIHMVQSINGAFVSGYFKPIIWISEQLQNSDSLTAVITHEKQHIKHHDQFWLLIITLVQRLFWFNPLSLILCLKTRKSIELSCDEACKDKLGKSIYQSHLAQLMMDKQQTTQAILNNQIHQDNSFNIHRIKQLNQEHKMTQSNKTKLSIIAMMALLLSAYSLVTVAHETDAPDVTDNQVLLELKVQRNDEEPAEFSILTNQGEMAHVTFNNHDFGFITHVIEADPKQIYTEMSISKIENGGKIEVGRPSIMTLNHQAAAIKFNDEDTVFDITIMAKTNKVKSPAQAATVKAAPAVPAPASVPALQTVPAAPSSAEPLAPIVKPSLPAKPVKIKVSK